MSEQDLYYINIHEKDDHAVLHQLGPKSLNAAERIEMGLNRNLDHNQFYTETVEVKEWREKNDSK